VHRPPRWQHVLGVARVGATDDSRIATAANWSAMRIVIEGHDLPGAEFVSDGTRLRNVHVAVQAGKDPVGLVRGDADAAHWAVDVRAAIEDGGVDLRGPAVHGKKGARFLYLTWGDVGDNGSFAMFRRAKLMIGDIEPELLAGAARDDGVLVASLSLTDERGGPRCARVRPPAISWRVGVPRKNERQIWAAFVATGETNPAQMED
jgi:hypothetical protein